MKLIVPVVIALAWFSCKNNTPSTTATAEVKKTDSVLQSKSDSLKYSLVIFFFSAGEGAEYRFIKAFEDSIKSYSSQTGKKIDYIKKAWGREGETDFCLTLSELTITEKDTFIRQTREQLKKAKWVNIFENYPCLER